MTINPVWYPIWVGIVVVAVIGAVLAYRQGWMVHEHLIDKNGRCEWCGRMSPQHDFGQGWMEWPPTGDARCKRCGGSYRMFANCGGLAWCKGK